MSRQIFFFISHCFTHIPRSFDKFIKFFDSYSHLIVCLIILRNLYTSLGEYNNRAIKLNYALNYLINCKIRIVSFICRETKNSERRSFRWKEMDEMARINKSWMRIKILYEFFFFSYRICIRFEIFNRTSTIFFLVVLREFEINIFSRVSKHAKFDVDRPFRYFSPPHNFVFEKL